MVAQMASPAHSPGITRRCFLEKSVKGTTALALSGLVLFTPKEDMAADRSPLFLDLPSPQFPAWTPDGKLFVTFIAEDGSYGILKTKKGMKDPNRLLSVGTATGQFNWPQGIAIDRFTAYIVDSNNARIQRFNLDSQSFLEPFGGLGKKSGLFLRPRGICIFENELFIADTRNHRIQVFSLQGTVKRVFGEMGDADDQLRLPASCAVSPQGEVFVVDSKHALVKVFDPEGRFLRKFGGFSSSRKEQGLLSMPTGIWLDERNDIVYIADTGNSRIQAFQKDGKFLRFVEAPGVVFKSPQGLALSDSGEMAISDPEADKVWVMAL
jgi:DNA-binding beta-propeller fold protein YncE